MNSRSIMKALNCDNEKWKKMLLNPIKRIIYLMPELSGIDQPERVAAINLNTLNTFTKNKEMFGHTLTDDNEFGRLSFLSDYGMAKDKITWNYCKILLHRLQISDHVKDQKKDEKNKKYNPVTAGIWNKEYIKVIDIKLKTLYSEMDKSKKAVIDSVMSMEDAVTGFWVD